MLTSECPTCEASLRTRGRRWLVSLALAFAAGVMLGCCWPRSPSSVLTHDSAGTGQLGRRCGIPLPHYPNFRHRSDPRRTEIL